MFEFRKMKRLARLQVRENRKTLALVAAVFALFMAIVGVSFRRGAFFSGGVECGGAFCAWLRADSDDLRGFLLSSILSVIRIAISGSLMLSCAKFFLSISREPLGFKVSFSQFLDGLTEWKRGIFGLLWSEFWTLMWTLLFVIPGIVKAVEYSQIFFILADFPKMSVPKALKISKVMTRGFKGDIFFAALSFVPWFLLSAATCGILLLWLLPYYCASFANAYNFLKERAIAEGRLLPSDFN